MKSALQNIHDRMFARYGEQRWWPADTPFEMMIGAVLTQATSWTNVEIAIARLKDADALSPAAIRGMDIEALALLIYSSGFYNAKARKLKRAGSVSWRCLCRRHRRDAIGRRREVAA